MSISLLANALSASGLTCAGLTVETPQTDAPMDDAATTDVNATARVDSHVNLAVFPKHEREIRLDATHAVTSLAFSRPERGPADLFEGRFLNHVETSGPGFAPLSFEGLYSLGKDEGGRKFNFGLEIIPGPPAPRAASPANSLAALDQRQTNSEAPNLYLFMSAKNEALVWGIADRKRSGVALRDQMTVGDMQVGFAWAMTGGRTALGVVQRKLKYNDRTGDHDVSVSERFAAISYSVKL